MQGGALFSKEDIEQHDPQFKAVPFDPETGKPAQLSAASNRVFQRYYVNPQSELDFIVLESLLNSTVLGVLSQSLVRLICGSGQKLQIKLHNEEHLSAEEKDKLLEKYQYVLDDLTKITDQITEKNDISWTDLITQLIQQMVDFGRGAILVNSWENPTNVMLLQARDLNVTETDSWGNFLSVQTRWISDQVSKDDLVYLYNPIQTSQTHSAGCFGVSMLKPALNDARTLLKIPKALENISTNCYAGAYSMIIKPQGSTQAQKEEEYKKITNYYKAGDVNILIEDPESVSTQEVNWNPQFSGLTLAADHAMKNIAVALGLPISLISQHDINRASLLGAIQLTLKTSILPIRTMISRQISRQFYQRHVQRLHPELTGKLTVELGFNELQIASYLDLTASALAIDSRSELTPKAFGTLIGLDNYEAMTAGTLVKPGGNGGKLQEESYNEEGDK